MSDVPSYLYRIDATDRLTYVSDEFVAFGRENEAPELNPANLLGVEIWSLIEGPSIKAFYQALFDRVRTTGTEVVVPFRCDSPDTIRQMELIMRPVQLSGIELEGRLLSTASRENVHLFNRYARRGSPSVPICSFCRRIAVSGRWLEASEAISRGGLLSGPTLPTLSEQICSSCAERGI